MRRRTGIDSRSFAGADETIVSMAAGTGKDCMRVLRDKGLQPEKCRGLLLGTSAVESRVLGLRTDDLAGINESDPAALVQRTAEKVARILGLAEERAIGHNYVCSTTAKLTEVGLVEERDILEGEFFLMVMAEKLGDNLDVRDRNTGFLFGDYTAATALQRGQTRFNILHAFIDTFPSEGLITLAKRTVYGPDGKEHGDRQCIQMNNGGGVLETASGKMIDAIERSLVEVGMEPEEVGLIVPHQANKRFGKVIRAQWERRGWAKPSPAVDIDVSRSGNNGSASWMRRMAEIQKQLKKGQVVMAPFVGAGPCFDPKTLSVGNIALKVGE